MGGNLPIGGLNSGLSKPQISTATSGSADVLSCVFSAVAKVAEAAPTSGITSNTEVTNSPQSQTPQTPEGPVFKSEMPAFSKLNLPENAKPQKEINGINIYATGSKEKISTTNRDGKMVISLGENGQQIQVPLGQMQPKGATIIYNGGTLAVRGLKDATVVGLKDAEIKNTDVNNQILAENCNGCTFDMNDKSNGLKGSRDDLVMDNCKSAKVMTGQNNAIVGLKGTTADVSYSSVVGKKAYDNPLNDWINKYHTNIAYDDTSKLSSSNTGSVNRDAHDPLIYDMVKKQGATEESNSYQLKDGSMVSASELLLNVINQDAASSSNGAKSMFNETSDAKAPKLSTNEMLSQLNQITRNM